MSSDSTVRTESHAKRLAKRTVPEGLRLLGRSLTASVAFASAMHAIRVFWPTKLHDATVFSQSWVTFPTSLIIKFFSLKAYSRSAEWGAAVTGFLWGATASSFFIKLWSYVYKGPDRKVLKPVHLAKPLDPLWGSGLGDEFDKNQSPLTWTKPIGDPEKSGTQASAWNQLIQALHSGFHNTRFTGFTLKENPKYHQFTWTTLAGRPATGKTRLMLELAHSLARTYDLRGATRLSFSKRAAIYLGELLRRVWPFTSRVDSDPWDIGWLETDYQIGLQHSFESRAGLSSEYLGKLSDWKPRRPTLFLLDDPSAEDLRTVISIFAANQSEYKFCVRLLVTCQAIPEGFEITNNNANPENKTGPSWMSAIPCFSGYLLELTEAAHFDENHIHDITTLYPDPNNRWAHSSEIVSGQVAELYRVSEGNPFLLELALEEFNDGESISAASRKALVYRRAKRVVKTLDAKLTASAFEVMLTICGLTIANSPTLERDIQEALSRDIETVIEPSLVRLRQCFNLKSNTRLPRIHPPRVGDAFVDLLLEERFRSESAHNRIIRLAWGSSFVGTLATIQRAAYYDTALAGVLRSTRQSAGYSSPIVKINSYVVSSTDNFYKDLPRQTLTNPLEEAIETLLAEISDESDMKEYVRLFPLMLSDRLIPPALLAQLSKSYYRRIAYISTLSDSPKYVIDAFQHYPLLFRPFYENPSIILTWSTRWSADITAITKWLAVMYREWQQNSMIADLQSQEDGLANFALDLQLVLAWKYSTPDGLLAFPLHNRLFQNLLKMFGPDRGLKPWVHTGRLLTLLWACRRADRRAIRTIERILSLQLDRFISAGKQYSAGSLPVILIVYEAYVSSMRFVDDRRTSVNIATVHRRLQWLMKSSADLRCLQGTREQLARILVIASKVYFEANQFKYFGELREQVVALFRSGQPNQELVALYYQIEVLLLQLLARQSDKAQAIGLYTFLQSFYEKYTTENIPYTDKQSLNDSLSDMYLRALIIMVAMSSQNRDTPEAQHYANIMKSVVAAVSDENKFHPHQEYLQLISVADVTLCQSYLSDNQFDVALDIADRINANIRPDNRSSQFGNFAFQAYSSIARASVKAQKRSLAILSLWRARRGARVGGDANECSNRLNEIRSLYRSARMIN